MSGSGLFLNLVLDGLVLGCVYALVALGFSLLWWIAGIIHLAHGGVMLAGGFGLFVAIESLGLPFVPACLLSAAASIVFGVALDRTIYRPLLERGTDEMGLLTASLGTLIVIEYALTIAFGPEGVTLDAGALRVPLYPRILPVLDPFALVVVGTTLVSFAAVMFIMMRTKVGREMRAVAENRELAHVLGMSPRFIYTFVAALAAALVMPGATFLLYSTGITPTESLHIVLIAAVVAIIGGRGSVVGTLIGALVIGVTESATIWYFSVGWRQLLTFTFLYVLLLVRPQGLFGKA